MLSAVTGRTRELALLLSMGATQKQIRTLTLVDGLLLGLGGGIAGVALGVIGAYLVVSRFICEALGWSLTFSLDSRDILVLAAGVVTASLLASLYPAWLAARTQMREASRAD